MKTPEYRSKTKKEMLNIHEEFIPYQTKPLDSKYRITLGGRLTRILGRKMNVDAYRIFIGRNGDILLRPTVSIPSSEAWVYQNPEVIGKVRKGLQEAQEGKTERVDNLDSFLKKL